MTNTEKKQSTSEKKSSAFYQRQYRQRLREQGLVKKEVWVLPEHNKILLTIEKVLRNHHDNMISAVTQGLEEKYKSTAVTNKKPRDNSVPSVTKNTHNTDSQWQTHTLFEALKKHDMFTANHAEIELIEGVHATIYISLHDFGDLPIFINVTGEQILVESLLFAANEIEDKLKFNEVVLRTHKYFPLSTISLDHIGDDGEYYQMFGSLSSTSDIKEVLIEIELLAHNVLQATEAYRLFFKDESL